ncbi:MAG: thioredoxin domain-containing protein [Micropepsaceae bacterium]
MDLNTFTRPQLIAGSAGVLTVVAGLSFWFFSGGPAQLSGDGSGGTCNPIETAAVIDDDFTVGEANAPITLVEYASQTCVHCAAFHRDAWPTIEATYVKTGLVRFVFRDFQRNRVDLAASVLGRCMGRDAFMAFTGLLFENQETWMNRADQDALAGLREMTRRAGMTNSEFDACMKKEDEAKRLVAIREKAVKDYCLEGTPTFLLNGKKLDLKGPLLEALDEQLRSELKTRGVEAPTKAAAAP